MRGKERQREKERERYRWRDTLAQGDTIRGIIVLGVSETIAQEKSQ